MRTHIDALAWWIGIGTICFLSLSAVVSGQEGPKLETMDQYTRLQIPITSGSSFRMLSGKPGEVTLVVDRVASGALEALPAVRDGRVKQVSVRSLGLDKAEISVLFHEAQTESFAYQQGNVLVLDLWRGAKSKEAASPPAKTVESKLPQQVKSAATEKRAPASKNHAHTSHAKAEATPSVPQVEPLKIDRDLFQKFILPMPELAITAKDGGIDLPPKFELDERWKFAKGDLETEDGKAFEFAKKLFSSKRYGLCLKTIEILLRDHPKTEYAEEIRFLQALAYQKLGRATKADFLEARADQQLEELAAKRNESGEALPFNRLIVMYFAKNELQKQNWLQAIQRLEYVAQITPAKNPDFPYVQMMLAEAYSKVNQSRRAERLYRFLSEKFPKHPLAKEAIYRIADLLAQQKNYNRVTEEGEAALRAYPDYEKARAEVLFHIGEAYFWLGQYAKAEKSFRRFTEIASAQTNSSLAWVRIGEIQELAKHDLVAARASYLRAKNGYPFSKGDLVATVRLARIDLPFEKEPNFVVRTLKEMLEDQTVEWDLKRMAELTLADYMMLTGEVEASIAIASRGMAQTDGVVYNLYRRAYERGLFARLSKLTEEKKLSEALALYDREKKWLEQYGPETFKVVASIYRGLGLFASANKFMDQYTTESAKRGRAPATAGAAQAFSREKAANSFARGAYSEVLTELSGQQDVHSAFLRAMSFYRLGNKAEAYTAADRALPGMAGAKPAFTDEMVENLAEILLERDMNERDFVRMEKEIGLLKPLISKESDRLTFATADTFWYQKRHAEAEKAYREALEKFPSSSRADRAKYNRGMSLVSLRRREEAVKLLTALRDSGQSVWSESAKQELELLEWEKKYSSVLKTLPPSGLGISN